MEMTADAAAATVPATMEEEQRQQQQHHHQSTSECSADQVDAPSLASFDHRAEAPAAKDEEDVTSCATMAADAIATVDAAGTDDRAAEEGHGRAVDIGNSGNDRPPQTPPLVVEPPPVVPSSEEEATIISTMSLDESDRDLIAARLAVLEASAEDNMNYIIPSSPNEDDDDDDDDVNAGAEADEHSEEEGESSDDHSSSTDGSDSSSNDGSSSSSNSEDVENENNMPSSPHKKSRGSIMVEDVTSY
jgi:hypothetical protein